MTIYSRAPTVNYNVSRFQPTNRNYRQHHHHHPALGFESYRKEYYKQARSQDFEM